MNKADMRGLRVGQREGATQGGQVGLEQFQLEPYLPDVFHKSQLLYMLP